MKRDNGFTAVELLITLFIAAAFLVSGYQLYNVVIKDGGEIRLAAKANNLAYEYMKKYASTSATNPCTVQTPANNIAISVEDMANVSLSIYISCPYGTDSAISKVESVIKYGNPQTQVRQATYVQAE